jgi:putative ABC transport system permease protein
MGTGSGDLTRNVENLKTQPVPVPIFSQPPTMRSSLRVPLAWLNLTHNKRRFFLSVAGVAFAVMLMLVELGFLLALLDGQTKLLEKMDADFFLVSTAKSTVTDPESFPLSRLYQARSVPGVVSAQPVYIRYYPFIWKNPVDADPDPGVPEWPIRVLAFTLDAEYPVFRKGEMPELSTDRELLLQPDTALLDAKSKPVYDVAARWRRQNGPTKERFEREVGGQKVRIVGHFRLGTEFSADGSLIMSARNLARFPISPDPSVSVLDAVQLGVIKLGSEADRSAVQRALSAALPEDVRLFLKNDLISKEKAFWLKNTPIGFIFILGLIVGFIVGVVICYQILATEVADHLVEYATLKAIGYHDRYLSGLVLQEALWLSILGFLLGIILGWLLYLWLEWRTGLPLEITFPRAGLILSLTVGMSVLSGLLALRRVRTADPAEIF